MRPRWTTEAEASEGAHSICGGGHNAQPGGAAGSQYIGIDVHKAKSFGRDSMAEAGSWNKGSGPMLMGRSAAISSGSPQMRGSRWKRRGTGCGSMS